MSRPYVAPDATSLPPSLWFLIEIVTEHENVVGSDPVTAKQVAGGSSWMVLARFALRIIGLASMLVLARLLVPEDFGLVALATTIVAVLDIASEFSFDAALIRDQHATRADYDTAWTLNALKQLTIGALLAAGAGVAADVFREPRLENVLYVLAVGTALDSLINMGVVDLVKKFQFNKQFVYLVVPKIASVVVTIGLAFVWRSYWVLIAGVLTNKVIKIVLSHVLVSYRPGLSLRRSRELIHFSKWLLLNNMCIFLTGQMDTFILGRMMGVQAVGLFTLAKEVALLPTTELVWPISQVIFPTLARIGHNVSQLAKGYLEATGVIWLVGAPAGFGIALIADLAVPVFLGADWLDAIPLMQVLGASGALRVLYSISGTVYLVLGRPYLLAFLTTIMMVMTAPALYVATDMYGLVGATYALLAMTVISLIINGFMTLRVLHLSLAKLWSYLWRPIVACLAMVGLVLALRDALPMPLSLIEQIAHLALVTVLGAVTYIVSDLGLWWLCGKPAGSEARVLDLFNLRVRVQRT